MAAKLWDRWQYINSRTGADRGEQLYDRVADPSERHNLAMAQQGVLARLRSEIGLILGPDRSPLTLDPDAAERMKLLPSVR